jgi:hypothetical protein
MSQTIMKPLFVVGVSLPFWMPVLKAKINPSNKQQARKAHNFFS